MGCSLELILAKLVIKIKMTAGLRLNMGSMGLGTLWAERQGLIDWVRLLRGFLD